MSQVNVLGTWPSNWGPVTFTGTPDHLSGHWDQGEGKQGQITAGFYNPTTGLLVFSYYQAWNNQNGVAGFLLSETNPLVGNWAQPNGSHGGWDLIRTRENPASHINVVKTWSSAWGPVTFTGTPDHLGGHWDQQGGKQGQITAGSYNPTTGLLIFSYYQTWNNQHGAAGFLLSASGHFNGQYVQPNGSHGGWDLTP
ncbi:hypothetical protein EPA93_33620 [Ktedonosporobacter rubrisoli]|uniref:Uncharacterized protein n=1 Tax=Ktedonosporobacter rubrisoli TaxID=2509675 RepID=A0A4P6JXY8_KTERU|nr:hypothetical protein [Ktedonosporobacter rubrisoli]QBD80647.1 hypothetical protein EPA93_33620 [Ktedonosporobacter rubrisoli]